MQLFSTATNSIMASASSRELLPSTRLLRTTCCITGGGPAGMMLGLLLARAGVPTVVLEKHKDFLRDFRGDTVHPSTLDVLHELGLLDSFLDRPHQKLPFLTGKIAEAHVRVADFTHLPTHCKFVALMPQWDFLNLLAERARTYPTFQLKMQAEVEDLVQEAGTVVGVRARTPEGPLHVTADLVVGADGRHSLVRHRAGLQVTNFGSPIDVFWMRLSQRPGDPRNSLGIFNAGQILVLLDRAAYWQCALVIHKGEADRFHSQGLPYFQQKILEIAPFFLDRVQELQSWDQISLLSVTVDRLRRWWRPGLLCIGDSAHAMSPVGGVGINLAIQDAVATANLLALPLRNRSLSIAGLAPVQRRRFLPTALTQAAQVQIQQRVITRVLEGGKQTHLPWPLRLLSRFPLLQRIPARAIGMGVLPEHVRTPDAFV